MGATSYSPVSKFADGNPSGVIIPNGSRQTDPIFIVVTKILNPLNFTYWDGAKFDPEKITPETHLFNDLEVGSLSGVELQMLVGDFLTEKINGVFEVPDEDWEKVETVGDLVELIKRYL